jgi:hypothetical protein
MIFREEIFIERRRGMRVHSHRPNANEYAQKNMRFNRFLLFRYMTAIFFFINLYWALLSLANWSWMGLVPVFLLLVDGAIIFEQTQKYWRESNRLFLTKIGYWIQTGINIFGILFVLVGKQEVFFPFLNPSARLLLLVCLTLGIVCCLLIERKVWLIENDRDRYLNYLRIVENKGGEMNEHGK